MKLRTYLETQPDLVTPEELQLFFGIERIMEHFPEDDDYGADHRGRIVILSCHIVARAVARMFPSEVKVVDGFYHPVFNHSWLETGRGTVIDVYPVGTIGGPILVDRIVATRDRKNPLYLQKKILVEEDFEQDWFKNAVDKVAKSFDASRV